MKNDKEKTIKKSKKVLDGQAKSRIFKIIDAILSAIGLLLGLQIAVAGTGENLAVIGLSLFFVMSASRLFHALAVKSEAKGVTAQFIKELVCSALYLFCALLFLFIPKENLSLTISAVVFFIVIATNVIFGMIFGAKKVLTIVFNVLLLLSSVVFIVVIIYMHISDMGIVVAAILSVAVEVKSLVHIVLTSFSQIKLGILQRIIRKTYASEILFGLFMLIVSFSAVFVSQEPGITTYYDALWYCFALVTTIGFGDFTVVTAMGRVLSVVLGIYGIIVVALVTSIIVNFYNEVKHESGENGESNDKSNDASADEGDNATVTEKGSNSDL